MKLTNFWKHVVCIAAIGCGGSNHAAALPQGWQIRPPAAEDLERALPSALQSLELAKDGRRLASVEIVVYLPYTQVMPIVAAALRQLGPVDDEVAQQPLSRLSDEWGEVLLSRRPDLVKNLVAQVVLPKLQQDVRDGALASSEIPDHVARIERTLRFQSGNESMAPLTEQYKHWHGSVRRTQGALGRSTSVLVANVKQLDAVFGQPASAVYLTRVDEFPNPKANFTGRLRELVKLDIFSPTAPDRLHRQSVPQELFSPVYDALSALPKANLQLGAKPEQWRAPATQPPLVSEPKLTLPDSQAQILQAAAVLAARSTDKFTVLADDSVLLYRDYPRALLYWSPATGGEPHEVWTSAGSYSKSQLARDVSGASAYLALEGLVIRFDAKSTTVATHPVAYDTPDRLGYDYIDYVHDGDGVPLTYRHNYRGNRDTLEMWEPVAQPAGDGSVWTYTLRYASPRQDIMKGPSRTNSQIKPVHWDGLMPTAWVEDLYGLTEIDGKTGHVLRVVKLPRRFGEVDLRDDSGMAQWTPEPFGSAKGGWIAVGFVLIEGQRRKPGLHVVDIASGKIRYSLTLPGQDSLDTAVGSPDGRLLAMGTGGPEDAVVLWNLQSGRSLILKTGDAKCSGIKQLQWSLSGKQLWGRCSNGLIAWNVPGSS
ncbi:WD40 repeat domain-containing protein [Pseudomonas sp. TWI628]|uniref:WD40 repeat domain-containing protein n=1 Tax=Pseudomonas sp. TWI628 TaxID=3136788 RepID=UPI00320991BB